MAMDLSEPGFYANVSQKVARKVIDGEYDRALLFYGTGIGVSISANKVPGIRVRAQSVRNSPRRSSIPILPRASTRMDGRPQTSRQSTAWTKPNAEFRHETFCRP